MRWRFGSGCAHADVIVAGRVEYDGDQVRRRPDGVPLAPIGPPRPLDRLLRDTITMNQHIAAQERMVEMVGGLLLGAEFTLPFL